MKTIILWYRADLRIHDHPALAAAAAHADRVVPVFIFDDHLLNGRHAGSNRHRFLLESLADLKASLAALGSDLVIRRGDPASVLVELAAHTQAEAVYYTADYSPYADRRDQAVGEALRQNHLVPKRFPGRLIVSTLDTLRTKTGGTYQIFTPFWKNWQGAPRRELAPTPTRLVLPTGLDPGSLPPLSELVISADLSPTVLPGGETAGRARLAAFLEDGLEHYHELNDSLAAEGTSRLSAYLHFGCVSPREIESQLPTGQGAEAWHRQLCWREFYHYILWHFPDNAREEFQARYRQLDWGTDSDLLTAWQAGRTGYPVVDAAMRQLLAEGWMHNRARLIVGSFLTKDLWLDWRLGERHFMKLLIDGDEANNNGNWQWIASVGVDPAPVFRRLYNPVSQHKKFDPDSRYVRRYVPELAHVPDQYIYEPWTMPPSVQKTSGCIIGSDYPARIIDHAAARQATLERFRQ